MTEVVTVERPVTTVTVDASEEVVVAQQTVTDILEVGIAGPQGPTGATGPTGPQGPVGGTYTHNQLSPDSTWTVNHNLGFNPNVVVVDSGGTIVEGDITYTSGNQLILTFGSAFSGAAYLS